MGAVFPGIMQRKEKEKGEKQGTWAQNGCVHVPLCSEHMYSSPGTHPAVLLSKWAVTGRQGHGKTYFVRPTWWSYILIVSTKLQNESYCSACITQEYKKKRLLHLNPSSNCWVTEEVAAEPRPNCKISTVRITAAYLDWAFYSCLSIFPY